MRPDPGFQGFSLCSRTAIVLPPLSSLPVTWGKLGREGSGETSPRPGCLPASFPAPSVTSSSSLVTLDENGWRASTLGTEQGPAPCAAARGVRRAAMSGITGMSHQTNATVRRNVSLTCSLLHLASIAHSSCDDKEVIPCHPGRNRSDYRLHRR
jgi:hypothetical protein